MFKWKDSYSVNIKEIDEQHKRLFELAGKVYELLNIKDDFDHYDEIMNIVEELKDYTIYHFNYEEKLMEKYGYQDIESHKLQHKAFINKINNLDEEEIDKDQNKVIMDMVVFVTDWISKHILKSDSAYKEPLNSKGVF